MLHSNTRYGTHLCWVSHPSRHAAGGAQQQWWSPGWCSTPWGVAERQVWAAPACIWNMTNTDTNFACVKITKSSDAVRFIAIKCDYSNNMPLVCLQSYLQITMSIEYHVFTLTNLTLAKTCKINNPNILTSIWDWEHHQQIQGTTCSRWRARRWGTRRRLHVGRAWMNLWSVGRMEHPGTETWSPGTLTHWPSPWIRVCQEDKTLLL